MKNTFFNDHCKRISRFLETVAQGLGKFFAIPYNYREMFTKLAIPSRQRTKNYVIVHGGRLEKLTDHTLYGNTKTL